MDGSSCPVGPNIGIDPASGGPLDTETMYVLHSFQTVESPSILLAMMDQMVAID